MQWYWKIKYPEDRQVTERTKMVISAAKENLNK